MKTRDIDELQDLWRKGQGPAAKLLLIDRMGFNMLDLGYWWWVFRDIFSTPVSDGRLPDIDLIRVNGIGRMYWVNSKEADIARAQRDRAISQSPQLRRLKTS